MRAVTSLSTAEFGCCQALQPGRQVRRLADDVDFAREALADHLADDYRSGRDPDPGGQGLAVDRRQCPNRRDRPQARRDGTLGGVLAGLRIAEIDQHAVAHELGNETAGIADRRGHRVMVSPQHVAQIFGVERL
jgi:hypothetical protein